MITLSSGKLVYNCMELVHYEHAGKSKCFFKVHLNQLKKDNVEIVTVKENLSNQLSDGRSLLLNLLTSMLYFTAWRPHHPSVSQRLCARRNL